MKVVILGGSGFVGSRLTELLLKDNHEVIIGDLVQSAKYPEFWTKCDIGSDEELRKILVGVDCLVNLAAAHQDNVRPVSLYHKTNVEGSAHICKIASEAGIKHIIFTSSVAVYGFPEYEYAEDGPKNPFNEYGKTKLAAEAVYEKWQRESPENRLTVIRPTVIFGEGNRGNIYNLLRQIASGFFMMIGPGKNKKSIAYVGNVAAFIKWNIENNIQVYSVYNYIDKPDLDMNELVAEFNIITGHRSVKIAKLPYWIGLMAGYGFDLFSFITRRNFPISGIRIKKFCAQTIFSSEKMQKSGFIAPFNMHEALKQTISYEFMDNKQDS